MEDQLRIRVHQGAVSYPEEGRDHHEEEGVPHGEPFHRVEREQDEDHPYRPLEDHPLRVMDHCYDSLVGALEEEEHPDSTYSPERGHF